jgi:hypothetical protein
VASHSALLNSVCTRRSSAQPVKPTDCADDRLVYTLYRQPIGATIVRIKHIDFGRSSARRLPRLGTTSNRRRNGRLNCMQIRSFQSNDVFRRAWQFLRFNNGLAGPDYPVCPRCTCMRPPATGGPQIGISSLVSCRDPRISSILLNWVMLA